MQAKKNTSNSSPNSSASTRLLNRYIRKYPNLRSKIVQNFLIRLHSSGVASVDEIYKMALGEGAIKRKPNQRIALNVDTATQWTQKERNALRKTILEVSAKHFSEEEIEDVVTITAKREEAQELEDIARLPGVSFDILRKKIEDYCKLPKTATPLPPSDAIATRVALMRQFVSDNLDFLTIARNFILIRDLEMVAGNVIGPQNGVGRIGGKAAGLLLARRILEEHFKKEGREPEFPIRTPESYFLRSDLNNLFVLQNGLESYASHKYKTQEEIEQEYPLVLELFHSGDFPPDVMKKVELLLEKLGEVPLIVRSSSLLEDSLGAVFSGKYKSIFLANQGALSTRVQQFLSAVKEVYASMLASDPLMYRRERNLVDYEEFMGVLVQPVVGVKHRDYFFPLCAGVAFSQNDFYRWDRRIRKEDGFIRLVTGLGTRAVDRVSSDYPRMVALTVPSLRPQGGVREVLAQSQKNVDVINLKTKQFETLPIKEVLGDSIPKKFDLVISKFQDGSLTPIFGELLDPSKEDVCVTFDRLIESTKFAKHMKEVLEVLHEAYGCPVDVEFAFDGTNFYLLQCRPLAKLMGMTRVQLPAELDSNRILFKTDRDVRTGQVRNIEFLVYVPSVEYDSIEDLSLKQTIGRVVSRINQRLHNHSYVLMGPGRWGSNDINLGVRINYADIRNTKVLIEIAREKEGYVPEVSFGTHFFQDLVESGIAYLPLYPDESESLFKESFLRESPNALPELLEDGQLYTKYVKVIHLPSVCEGLLAHLVMDGEKEQAVCYLAPRDGN